MIFICIGQIVFSLNVIMEIEIFVLLKVCEMVVLECFIFYFLWMCMKYVIKDELFKMDVDSDRCVLELLDVKVSVMGYVCFVVIMLMGLGYYCVL